MYSSGSHKSLPFLMNLGYRKSSFLTYWVNLGRNFLHLKHFIKYSGGIVTTPANVLERCHDAYRFLSRAKIPNNRAPMRPQAHIGSGSDSMARHADHFPCRNNIFGDKL